jgi:hypothetical protein
MPLTPRNRLTDGHRIDVAATATPATTSGPRPRCAFSCAPEGRTALRLVHGAVPWPATAMAVKGSGPMPDHADELALVRPRGDAPRDDARTHSTADPRRLRRSRGDTGALLHPAGRGHRPGPQSVPREPLAVRHHHPQRRPGGDVLGDQGVDLGHPEPSRVKSRKDSRHSGAACALGRAWLATM